MHPEPDYKRLFVAKCLQDGDLNPIIDARNYVRSENREVELSIDALGRHHAWINEDEPPFFPAVSGTHLGAGN